MHNLIFLTDLARPDLDPYVRFNEAQLFHALEPQPGLFIAESPKVIERALRAGYQPASLLVEEKALDRDLADLDHEMADKRQFMWSVARCSANYPGTISCVEHWRQCIG